MLNRYFLTPDGLVAKQLLDDRTGDPAIIGLYTGEVLVGEPVANPDYNADYCDDDDADLPPETPCSIELPQFLTPDIAIVWHPFPGATEPFTWQPISSGLAQAYLLAGIFPLLPENWFPTLEQLVEMFRTVLEEN